MYGRLITCALLVCAVYGAEPRGIEILQRAAAAYRSGHESELHAVVQTLQGTDVSERQVTQSRSALEAIDQGVKEASIAREEQDVVDGKRERVYVVRVVPGNWPPNTVAGAEFAMYYIDQRAYRVHKVVIHAPNATQIVLYDSKPGRSEPESTGIIGMPAPDFTLQDTSGHTVNLHDLLGKVVLIDFWATWCEPCRQLMPELQELQRNFAKQGLVVLGLNVGEETATVSQFAQKQSYTFPLLLGAEPEVTARYYVESYPTTLLIDRKGRIVSRDRGFHRAEDLSMAVKDALGSKP